MSSGLLEIRGVLKNVNNQRWNENEIVKHEHGEKEVRLKIVGIERVLDHIT